MNNILCQMAKQFTHTMLNTEKSPEKKMHYSTHMQINNTNYIILIVLKNHSTHAITDRQTRVQ